MDIARSDRPARAARRTIIFGGGVVAAAVIAITTLGIGRLKPAAPAVDRSAVWVDTVRRGPLVREVRAPGALVSQQVLWITARTDGRVEQIRALPGARVDPGTPLLVLSNPELERTALDAESDVRAAEANLTDIRIRFEGQLMDQKAALAAIASEMHQAQLQLGIDEKLAKEGLTSSLVLDLARTKATELAARNALAVERVKMAQQSLDAQVAAQQTRVAQARALAALRREEVLELTVRSGIVGVLQEMLVEPGQRVTAGTRLAKVADPNRLEAQLQVPQLQAKDLRAGQRAQIDTGHGTAAGHVMRVSPAVQNGTIMVDVAFDGSLPADARADQSVDGTIEIGRLADALFVGRPALAAENSTAGVFKLLPGADEAVRVPVDFGVGSANRIEVRRGLAAGDRVILSDTSQWQAADRLRLH